MSYGKRLASSVIAAGMVLSTFAVQTVLAQVAPSLGTAASFAVLGASAVTNTGPTVLGGNLGVSPGTAITGFPPGGLTGTIHSADAVAAQAQLDATSAFGVLAGQACNRDLSNSDLGGLTLQPGVYCFTAAAQLTGTLTLDASGDPNGVFIFKIGSTLTTASNSNVVVIGGSPCNVYFQVGSSATLGTGTQLAGTILAQASITVTTGASITGGAYALTGAVTLGSNSIVSCMGTIQVCKVAGSGVTPGTSFQFVVDGNPATLIDVPAGPSPAGSCGPALAVRATRASITETLPSGITLTSVSTLPSPGLLVSSNLSAGTVTVEVNPGGQTIATFLNAVVPVVPATGFLQICKVAGDGVTVGSNFTFDVAGTSVVVPAGAAPGGTCSAPLVVPSGQILITETLPSGATLTSVSTLPSAGLLVSAALQEGQATVTVAAGGQTITTFTNAVIPINGSIQICKIAGTGIVTGRNFTFDVAGTPVTVPAGPGPAGSCSLPIVAPAGVALITETVPAGTALVSVTTLPGAGLLVASNVAAGTATVTVNAGAQTTVTFLNAANPVTPTTGFLQVCKVAGAGVAVGTNFTFDVAGTSVTIPAGPAPSGTCSTPLVKPSGPAVITETLPSGTTLTSVTTVPAGLLVSSNLTTGTATVTVTAGGQTIALFTDTVPPVIPTTGFLQVCKIAGSGVVAGTVFAFNVAGTPVNVPAGSAPGGSCSTPLVVPAGPAVVTETLPAGTTLSSVATVPAGRLVSSTLAAGTATVTVSAGGQTTVTFLNIAIPVVPTTGFLQICKVAGAGIVEGTTFSFNVAGVQVTVPAGPAPGGSCSQAVAVPAGAAFITESAVAGTILTAVTTLPDGLLLSSNLAARTASVTVNAGEQTIATFLNTVIPAPTTGTLQLCKVAGQGVAVGTMFVFDVAGTPVTVSAGPAPGGSCAPVLVLPAGPVLITEALPSGTTLTSVITSPGSASLVGTNLTAGQATVTVTAGGQTVATFLNSVIPPTGFLRICKVAGAGVALGTNFTFSVAGTPVVVSAGPAPLGSCSSQLVVPQGQNTIAEILPNGTVLTSVFTSPNAGLLVSANLAAGLVTVTVNAAAQTTATFLNTVTPITGSLRICKIAGAGVAPGGRFSFVAGGVGVAVQAGSCTAAGSYPVGTIVAVAETPTVGTIVSAIGVTPVDRQGATDLPQGTVAVTIGAGATEVAFTNTSAGFGLLKVCKLAGTGIAPGTKFTFVSGGASFTVPAGYCVKRGLLLVGTVVTITEAFSPVTTVSAISVLPADRQGNVDLVGRSAVATIGAGVTEVYFTNVAKP